MPAQDVYFRSPRICVKEQVQGSEQTARKINPNLELKLGLTLSWNRPTVKDGDRLCYKQAHLMTFASSRETTREPRTDPDRTRS